MNGPGRRYGQVVSSRYGRRHELWMMPKNEGDLYVFRREKFPSSKLMNAAVGYFGGGEGVVVEKQTQGQKNCEGEGG